MSVVSDDGVEKNELIAVAAEGAAVAFEGAPKVNVFSGALTVELPKLNVLLVELGFPVVCVSGVTDEAAGAANPAKLAPKEGITGTETPSAGRVLDDPKTELGPPNENPVDAAGFAVTLSLGLVSDFVAELSVLPNVKGVGFAGVVVGTVFVADAPNAI